MSTLQEFDLVIVGGGLVGASLAVALRNSGMSIAVVERWPVEHAEQPSYDERTVALTWSTRCIYDGMDIWSLIAKEAEPIRNIHVSEQGQFGMTHLSHHHVGTSALGYVVPARAVGHVTHSIMTDSDRITLFCPAEATDLDTVDERQHLTLTQDGQTLRLSAPLVVIADGGRSPLLAEARQQSTPYPQQALLSIVTTDQPHQGRAWERFTREGPLALLPLSQNRLATVWTSMPEPLAERQAMSDDVFIDHLQQAFGNRAGNLSNPSLRKAYPLNRSYVAEPAKDRRVVLGNAAQTVHPVAGQGFNLGLRDVATLAELLYQAHNKQQDIGADTLLQTYNQMRKHDSLMVRQFTHSLITLFAMETPGISFVRNLGLKGIELLPPVKRFLLRRTMGLTNASGALSRGLPLESLATRPEPTPRLHHEAS